MATKKDIPIYKMEIRADDPYQEDGVMAVSFVPNPATEKNFLVFNEEKKPELFKVADEARRIVTGVVMLADTPIYRYSKDMGEYYVIFDASTVMKCAQSFFKNGSQHNVNLYHDFWATGVTMFESWVVDNARGVEPLKGFEDAPQGSWFGSFIVENENVWNLIQSGEFKGFSIEGFFNLKPEKSAKQEEALLSKIMDILKQVEG